MYTDILFLFPWFTTHFKLNRLIVHFFMTILPSVTLNIVSVPFQPIQFMSQIGGILGVFLGMSIFSMAEVVELLISLVLLVITRRDPFANDDNDDQVEGDGDVVLSHTVPTMDTLSEEAAPITQPEMDLLGVGELNVPRRSCDFGILDYNVFEEGTC